MCRPVAYPILSKVSKKAIELSLLIGAVEVASGVLVDKAAQLQHKRFQDGIPQMSVSEAGSDKYGAMVQRKKRRNSITNPSTFVVSSKMQLRRTSLQCNYQRKTESTSDEEWTPTKKRKLCKRRTNEPQACHTDHLHERVCHDYHDYSHDPPKLPLQDCKAQLVLMNTQSHNGASPAPFPVVLYQILESAEKGGFNDVISWQSHGRAFHVHDPNRFVTEVMPRYFRQTRFSSFQRQLSLYEILRLCQKGPDHNAYYHECFLRGRLDLCIKIKRERIKGHWVRPSASPETEPNFYLMEPVAAAASYDEKSHQETLTILKRDISAPRTVSMESSDKAKTRVPSKHIRQNANFTQNLSVKLLSVPFVSFASHRNSSDIRTRGSMDILDVDILAAKQELLTGEYIDDYINQEVIEARRLLCTGIDMDDECDPLLFWEERLETEKQWPLSVRDPWRHITSV